MWLLLSNGAWSTRSTSYDVTGRHRVRGMFHSTAMVPDYDRACARLARLAGLRVLEYSAAEAIGRRGGMTWIGDNSLEIGEPLGAETAPGRFVAAHGGGLHSVAVQVTDLEATVAHLNGHGVKVAARPGPGFCFSDPRDTHGVFIEWAEVTIPEDPRLGAPLPPFSTEPVLAVARHAYVGAVVSDPVATARFLGALVGTGVTFETPGLPATEPAAGVGLGDCTLALFPLPDQADLWGRPYPRPRTHLLALGVEDVGAAADAAEAAGYPVLRRHHGHHGPMAVLDPASTGGVQTALVDRLLPGDPRQ
jgi:catechol 2,3-dioxygenase-like lactoylglutathione lyase family enzyme